METKKQIDELLTWLPRIQSGKTLESIMLGCAPLDILNIGELVDHMKRGRTIRIKQIEFPAAPDGKSWHNPHGLTTEEVCIDAGYELLFKCDIPKIDINCLGIEIWSRKHQGWISQIGRCNNINTYRVKTAEHPVGSLKPKEVELNPVSESSGYCWAMIIQTGKGRYLSHQSSVPDSGFPPKFRGQKILAAYISGNAPGKVRNCLLAEAGKYEAPVYRLPGFEIRGEERSVLVTSYGDNPKIL